jgi:hypothetical protein
MTKRKTDSHHIVNISIQRSRDTYDGKFLHYLHQDRRRTIQATILDSLRLLWEPYFLAQTQKLTPDELLKVVTKSQALVLNHYELMCLEFGIKNPLNTFNTNSRNYHNSDSSNEIDDDIDDEDVFENININRKSINFG